MLKLLQAIVIAALIFLSAQGWAQSAGADWAALNSEAISLYQKNQYEQAVVVAKRALDLAERNAGTEHSDLVASLSLLALLYKNQGRYALAEPLVQRSLAIEEKALGPDHLDVARILHNLAFLHQYQGQYSQAEALFKRSLLIKEKALGSDDLDTALSVNSLGSLYQDQSKYALADQLYKRSLAVREKALGPDHPDVAGTLNNLASLYREQGEYALAEPLYTRSLAIAEKSLGTNHPYVATSLNNLAELYRVQGQYAQAEPLCKRSLAIREKALGLDHPDVAKSLFCLAYLYRSQGQYVLAEPLFLRAHVILEKALGPEHPDVATSLNNLALLFCDLGQCAMGEPFYKRSLKIAEKTFGPDHPNVATTLNNLASLYEDQGQHAQAETFFKRSLEIKEKAFGPENPSVAGILSNLATIYQRQGQFIKAEGLLKRSLAIVEKALGPDHPEVATILNQAAELFDRQERLDEALAYSRRGFRLLQRRFSTAAGNRSGSRAEQKTKRTTIASHIARLSKTDDSNVAAESFDAFQLAQTSNTGQSVAQMAVRFAAQGGELAKAIRELQGSQEILSRTDKAFIEALGQPPAKLDTARITALREDLARLEKSLVEQGRAIASRFPNYDALVSPAPLAVSEVQKLLRPEEAMVAYLIDDSAGSFAWVVRADRIEFRQLDITAAEISSYVKRLRAKLDPAQNSRLLPFDARAANALYSKIFAPLESALAGTHHVILVPDGALQGLPFAVLVDRVETDTTPTSWLVDRYAFSTVPSVSALRALRAFTRTPLAEAPFVGFGDPVLGGRVTAQRQLAARSLFVADDASTIGPTRIGIADVRAIRQAESLPETADELRALSAALGASATSLYLQDKATETNAKNLDLSRYRVIAFATHGLMAGEMTGVVEPGLILTPPAEGTLLDDGYLTASEVTQLKLNADWVLLSACNTAAPDGTPGAEGLSGLAKAFFYAGARSLLVSNWYVASDAAVRITTEMLKSYSADPKLGKAEALRSSMKKLRADPKFAHPLYWAPFTVVGEGGVTAGITKK